MTPDQDHNLLVVLGPTASGKTHLGVRLARALHGEVVSADSRQVYRGLTIGAGKDLDEYVVDGETVPYHLIDVVDLDHEFSVFEYQSRCFQVIEDLTARHTLPVLVGGTGLYIEAVLKGYRMVEVPENPGLRAQLAGLSAEELAARLTDLKPGQHNTTDLVDRDRTMRAIEIAAYTRDHEPPPAPELHPLILGTRWPRDVLLTRIRTRLVERIDAGMIEEVQGLLAQGVPSERLEFLGLEYRYVTDYLEGRLATKEELVEKLFVAICQFAKRQGTWFRRMERRGACIHWVDRAAGSEALKAVSRQTFLGRSIVSPSGP
jgi:tRNA dimethylallyltransferase